MKKIISLLLTICLFTNFQLQINASSEVSYTIEDEYGNEIMEVVSIGSTSNSEWFDYVDFENNKTYRSELKDGVVTVTDLSDNSIILTAILTTVLVTDEENTLYSNQLDIENLFNSTEGEAVAPLALIDTYDQWHNFGLVYERSMTLSNTEAATLSACISALTFFMGVGIVGTVATAWISSWATSAYNDNVRDFSKKVYRSQNKYCDILVKEYQEVYKGGGTKLSTSATQAVWLTTPWDYSTPAACRTLTERY